MVEKKEETPTGEDIVEEKLGSAIQKFIRRPEFSAFERLVCSYLVQGITGDPLETIIFTMRAAMTLDEDRCQLLGIDFQEVVGLYGVAQIINTATKEYMYIDNTGPVMHMAVETLDWNRDIIPWAKGRHYAFAGVGPHYKKYSEELLKTGTRAEIFDYTCKRLTIPGYNNLKADYLIYAMPKSQEITRKLSEIISPSTYTEIFRVFTSPQARAPTRSEELG